MGIGKCAHIPEKHIHMYIHVSHGKPTVVKTGLITIMSLSRL